MFALLGFAAQVCVFLFITAILISCVSLPQSTDTSVVDESDATLPIASSCAKVMTPAAITTTIDKSTVFAYDYSAMTVVALKALCKSQGFKRYSSLRKHELIALLSEF